MASLSRVDLLGVARFPGFYFTLVSIGFGLAVCLALPFQSIGTAGIDWLPSGLQVGAIATVMLVALRLDLTAKPSDHGSLVARIGSPGVAIGARFASLFMVGVGAVMSIQFASSLLGGPSAAPDPAVTLRLGFSMLLTASSWSLLSTMLSPIPTAAAMLLVTGVGLLLPTLPPTTAAWFGLVAPDHGHLASSECHPGFLVSCGAQTALHLLLATWIATGHRPPG